MKHFINKDKYFSFKEYPNKGNIINSITGTYASSGQITETLIGKTGLIEFPKTENLLSTKEHSRYNFPKNVTITINQTISQEDLAKYNGGVRYEIWGLRARNKRDADYSSDSIEYFNNETKTYFSKLDDVTENCYVKITNGLLPINDNGVGKDLLFSNFINAQRTVGFIDSVFKDTEIYYNEAVTYYEPTIFGTPYYVQSFLYGYIVKVYGKTIPLEFKNKFSFSDVSSGSSFNIELEQNELLTDTSTYKAIDLANNIANRIFENYKNGRPTAELEWIGDPNVKVGDTVVIDNGIEYFVYGKKVSFSGGYGEKLLLIKKSSWTSKLTITSRFNAEYVVYADGELVEGIADVPQYSIVTIPMSGNEEFNQVFVGETVYNMPQLTDISFIIEEDTYIYFNKTGGTIN